MKTWNYLINPFLVAGSQSRTKAITLSTYSHGALFERQADAFFGPLFTFYDPLHVALNQEQAEWLAQRGTQKGATQSVDQLLHTLSPDKITEWDRGVDNIFHRGTPEYTAIFPQGHGPFQTGGKDQRITAVEGLSTKLGEPAMPPAIAPIKLNVDTFLGQLLLGRTTQTGEISMTESESTDASAAVTNAMNGLYKILGDCIGQFSDNPTAIEPIFDLQTLRHLPQTQFTDHVAVSVNKNIFKRTLEPDVQLRIKVLSSAPLNFYFAEEKNDAPGVLFVKVDGLEEEVVTASQLGNVPAAAWFKVDNTSSATEGHFEVEIL